MAIKKYNDRQWPLAAAPELTPRNAGAGNEVTFHVPPGALVLRVSAFTGQVFDGAATLTVKDETTTFINAQDLTSAGSETATGAPKFYPTGGLFTASIAGSPTVGSVMPVVEYVIRDRGNEIQE